MSEKIIDAFIAEVSKYHYLIKYETELREALRHSLAQASIAKSTKEATESECKHTTVILSDDGLHYMCASCKSNVFKIINPITP